MATRRNVQNEKPIPEAHSDLSPSTQPSDTAPSVPAHVIYKLLGFTLAMICIPIGSYFLSVNVVFGGNATYAGGFAAIMANVVLIAYIIVAMREDQTEKLEAEEKRRKAQ